MKLLRYLKKVDLYKAERIKQPNGSYISKNKLVKSYKAQVQNINDQVSATIYGAGITKMLKLSTSLLSLEKYLMPKVDNKEDNISLYYIKVDNAMYKIKSVLENGIEIERI